MNKENINLRRLETFLGQLRAQLEMVEPAKWAQAAESIYISIDKSSIAQRSITYNEWMTMDRDFRLVVMALALENGYSPIIRKRWIGEGRCLCAYAGPAYDQFLDALDKKVGGIISCPMCDEEDTLMINPLGRIFGLGLEILEVNKNGTLFVPPSLLTEDHLKEGLILV